jgi:PAS domain S-box-containing protein
MYPITENPSTSIHLYKLVTNLQLEVVAANNQVLQAAHLSLAQIIGTELHHALPFLDAYQLERIKKACLKQPGYSQMLEVHWAQNGKRLHLTWMVCSIMDSAGDPEGLQWVGVDSTGFRQTGYQSRMQQLVLDHISDALVVYDAKMVVISFSKKAEQMFGLSAHQVFGKKLTDHFTVQPTPVAIEKIIGELKRNGQWLGAVQWVNSEGKELFSYTQIFAVTEDEGTVCGYVSINRDLTYQFKLQQNHQEQTTVKTLVEEIMDQTGAMAWATDAAGKKRYMNATFRKAFYVDEHEVSDRMSEFFSEAEIQLRSEENKKVIEEGISLDLVEAFHLPDGREVKYRMHKFPVQTDEGRFAAGFAYNITNEVMRENELQNLKQRYEKAANILADVIADWDIEKDRIWRSDPESGIEVHDTSAQCINDRYQRLHPDDLARFKESLHEAIQSHDESWQCEYRYQSGKGDGRYKVLHERGVFLRNEAGKTVRMISVVQDVTEKRRLQLELEEKKRAVTEATIAGQEAERSELARELHDNVGQILAMCKLFVDITSDTVEHEYLDKCREQLQRAITEIRSLSHRLSPETLFRKGLPVAIADMVNNINQTGKLRIDHKKCTRFENADLPPRLQIASFRIVQECINNILKHAQATEATIHICLGDTDLSIEVSDNGKGFDPADGQSGIGLKNIYDRIEMNGGSIDLQAAPGKGCSIYVKMPLVAEEVIS